MRVPRYQSPQNPQGFVRAGTVVTPMQPAAQAAAQAQRFGAEAMRAGIRLRAYQAGVDEEADQAEATAAANLYDDYTRTVLDPQKGYLSKLGQEAKDGQEEVLKGLQERRKEFGDKLQNPRQKELYEGYSRDRQLRVEARVNDHAAKQVKAYAIGEQQAAVAGRVSDYVGLVRMTDRNPDDELRALVSLQIATRDLLELQGTSPESAEAADAMRLAGDAAVVEAASQLMNDGRVDEAEALFESRDLDSKTRKQLMDRVASVRRDLQIEQDARDKQAKSQQADQLINDLAAQTLPDPQGPVEAGQTSLPQGPEPSALQRATQLRGLVEDHIAKNKVGLAEANDLRARAEARITRIKRVTADAQAAATETAQQLWNTGRYQSIEQLPNYPELVRTGADVALRLQIETAQADARAKAQGDAKDAAEKLQDERNQQRKTAGELLLNQLESGEPVVLRWDQVQVYKAMGMDMSWVDWGDTDLSVQVPPGTVSQPFSFADMSRAEARMVVLGIGGDVVKYDKVWSTLTGRREKDAADQLEDALKPIKERIAIRAGINISLAGYSGTNEQQRMLALNEQYRLNYIYKELQNPQLLQRFGLHQRSTPEDWAAAAPAIAEVFSRPSPKGGTFPLVTYGGQTVQVPRRQYFTMADAQNAINSDGGREGVSAQQFVDLINDVNARRGRPGQAVTGSDVMSLLESIKDLDDNELLGHIDTMLRIGQRREELTQAERQELDALVQKHVQALQVRPTEEARGLVQSGKDPAMAAAPRGDTSWLGVTHGALQTIVPPYMLASFLFGEPPSGPLTAYDSFMGYR